MGYLRDAKSGDEVFDVVFGHGRIKQILHGYWDFLVDFDSGYEVPFNFKGEPAWGSFDYQTLFYKTEIDMEKMDFSAVGKLPTPKKIIKWRLKNKLEIKCPSGAWVDGAKCPDNYVEDLLEQERFWMFRKADK